MVNKLKYRLPEVIIRDNFIKELMGQFFFSIFIFLAFPLSAAEWTINPAHSEILFEVSYLKWGEVSGRFEQFSGNLNLDETEVPRELKLMIKTNSINTGNAMRDNHLQGSDFLQSKTLPHIIFSSRDIKKISNDTFRVNGALSIRNITKLHSLEIKLSDVISDTWNYKNRFVKFTTLIDRRDFSLTWNKTISGQSFLVGNDILVKGTFQLQPLKGVTPNSKHMIPDTAYIRKREMILRKEIADSSSPSPLSLTSSKGRSALGDSKISHQTRISAPLGKAKGGQQISGEKGFLWWVCYAILGLFSFFGVSLMGIYGKKFLLNIFLQRYDETGIVGYLSDALLIGVFFLYSWAYWVIGWG
jgi:polyisoprenoid-binding protein YceI